MALYAPLLPLQISFWLKFCSAPGLGALLHVSLWTSDPDLSLLLTVCLTVPSSLSLFLSNLSLSLIVSPPPPVSLDIFLSVSLCVLVCFCLFLCVCVSVPVSQSVSPLLFSSLSCSVLSYLHCSTPVSHFWSLCPFSHFLSHSLSLPLFPSLQTFHLSFVIFSISLSLRLCFCPLCSSPLSLFLFLSLNLCLSLSFSFPSFSLTIFFHN